MDGIFFLAIIMEIIILLFEYLLIVKGHSWFGLYSDDFGNIIFLKILILMLYVLHEPLKLGINESLFELVLMVIFGNELGRYLLVFFMHKEIN